MRAAFGVIVGSLLVCVGPSDARAATVSYVYDELGRLVGVIDPTGQTAVYTYDSVGNLLSIARYASSVVSIIDFTPNSGSPGVAVTISGTGFSAVTTQNTVTFNGVTAPVSSASVTQLVVTVPGAATTGPIRVTAPGGSALSTQAFTVTAPIGPPTITNFTPNVGPPGTLVTITGANFDVNPALDKLAFNTTRATTSSSTGTTITTRVPSGATSGPIRVTTPRGNAVSTDVFVTADVAVPIAVDGPPVTVTLGGPRQTARLTFVGTPGQRVSLGMVDVTNPGSDVSVLRLDGTVVAPAKFVGLSGNTLDVSPLPGADRYVILVDPRDNNTGSMTLYLSAEVTGGITVGGSSSITTTRPGQNARLSFAGTVGQQVSLQVAAGAVGSDVSILNPDGTTLAGPTFAGSSGGTIDQQTLPGNGTYAIAVNPRSLNTGSATLSLTDATDVTGTITIGGAPVTVTIARPGQNGRLSFSGNSGQQVSLQMGTGAVASDVSILNPDGSTLAGPTFAGSSGGTINQTTLPVAGTYTVFVNPRSTNTGSMTLTLLDVSDFTGTIAIGGSAVTVTITQPGQNARLTFSGPVGQQVSLQTSTGVGSDVSILKPDGTPLTPASFAGASTTAFVDQATLAVPGTYTVLVDPRSTNTGSLTLTLIDATDVTGTITIGGSAVMVTLARPGQNARLTFSGTMNQQVTVQLSAGTVGTGTLSLLKPDGASLASATGDLNNLVLPMQTLPVAGIYTIVIDPGGTRTGNLTVRVTSP